MKGNVDLIQVKKRYDGLKKYGGDKGLKFFMTKFPIVWKPLH